MSVELGKKRRGLSHLSISTVELDPPLEMSPEVQDFTQVSHKKVQRAPKSRKGKQRPRERSVAERVEARRAALQESGYVKECQSEQSLWLCASSRLISALEQSYSEPLFCPAKRPALPLRVRRRSASFAWAWGV